MTNVTITLVDGLDQQSITVYDGVFVDSGSGGGGDVASVNGQTGVVVLAASDVGAQPVDTDLTAIAALATTPFGRSLLTAADAAAVRVLTGAGTSSLALGTTSSTAKAGDYQPAAANISDATTIGRTVLTAADAAAVRTAIGAGTSNLAIGTSSSTAKAGDYQPTSSNISDSTTVGRALITAVDAAAGRTAIGAGTSSLAIGTTGTTAAAGNDSRLSDARTPTAHAASHASAGSDPLTLAESQVTNLTTDLAAKAPLASPTFTGTPAAPTATGGTNTTQLATTAFVASAVSPLAPLASPTFTGHPVGVTETAGNNSTRLATTAYADNAVAKQPEVLMFALGDETTAITTGLKVTARMPFAMTLTSVRASLTTASSSGIPAVNIKESGTTIFSTTLTIDATELTSTTAATPAVLSDTSLADDAEMTFIVDTAGTGAKGLKVTLIGTRT